LLLGYHDLKQFATLGFLTDVKLFEAFLISGTTDEVDGGI